MSGTAPATIRGATPADIPAIARLFDMANAGLIEALWSREAGPGETWLDVAAREMGRDDGELTLRTTVVAEAEGEVAGMLIVNFLPDPWPDLDAEALPPHARPFWRLRAMIPGRLFVRDIAVVPARRGQGIARALLAATLRVGETIGHTAAGATTHEGNAPARALFASFGFGVAASEPVREHPTYDPASSWLLLTRDAAPSEPKTPTGAVHG